MAVGAGGDVLPVEVEDVGPVPVPVCVVTTGDVLSGRDLGLRAGNGGSLPAAAGTAMSTRFSDSGRAATGLADRGDSRVSSPVSFASKTPIPNRTGTINSISPSRTRVSVQRTSPSVHRITDRR